MRLAESLAYFGSAARDNLYHIKAVFILSHLIVVNRDNITPCCNH